MMRKLLLFLSLSVAGVLSAADGFWEKPEKYWNFEELAVKPQWRANPYPESEHPPLKAMLVKGKGPGGSQAEFFVYYGYPEGPVPKGGFPGALLVHGGGGTAFPNYIKMWIDQGFAVMALDWYNQRPVLPAIKDKTTGRTSIQRKELPGGRRNDIVANVANMTIAHSLFRTMPEVNAKKTVFVGLSWGSWYGAITSSVDPRYAGVVQIYCGTVTRNQTSMINGRFLNSAKCPMWWFVSTNDRNMTPESAIDAWNVCPGLAGKTIVNDLPHSHIGFEFGGVMRMAKYFTGSEPSLPVLSEAKVSGGRISAKILERGKGVDHAKIAWTDSIEEISWKRKWNYAAAQVKGDTVEAAVPEGATMVYLAAYEKKEGRFRELCGTTSFVVLKEVPRSNLTDSFVRSAREEYAKDPDCRISIAIDYCRCASGGTADKIPGIVGWEEIEGVRNVRDIGGWTGLKTGMVYRGTELAGVKDNTGKKRGHFITDEGKRNMRERLGIRSDMDLRSASSSERGGFLNESPLGKDVALLSHPLGSYMDIYCYAKPRDYGRALKEFARKEIYPVYVHCAGGADRTGTLCFLLETLCGVSVTDATIDYELTGLSPVGCRLRNRESVQPFALVVRTMNTFPGKTFSDKVAYWAENVAGLTKDEIAAIRSNLMKQGADR